MAELRGDHKSVMSPKNQADKAAILAREIVDQHRELSVSSDRGDRDLEKVRDTITMER